MTSLATTIAVFIGGGLGSLARYGISLLIVNKFKSSLPIATIIANSSACLTMGIMLFLMTQKAELPPILRPLILIGFCGGFSTFSTFSLETVVLLKVGDYWYAIANVLISLILCCIILWQFVKIPS